MNPQNLMSEDRPQTDQHQNEQLPETLVARNLIKLAIIRCAGLLLGIDVKWVQEVRPFAGATPVYGLPPYWVGITALRGHLYAVLDLRKVLYHQRITAEGPQQIVFTAINDHTVGLLVDAVEQVRQIDAATITAGPTPDLPFILGSTPEQINVLDLPALYADLHRTATARRENHVET
jgi:chemotaxis signal transduction protein